MAQGTVSINVVKWGYIDQANPDTHYTINHNTAYLVKEVSLAEKILLFGLDTLPSDKKRYRILGVDVAVNVTSGNGAELHNLNSDFNAATVTWNNGRPDIDVWDLRSTTTDAQGNLVYSKTARAWLDPTTDMDTMQQLLQYRGFAIEGNGDGCYVKTKKVGGGVDMVKVTYDSDSVLHGIPVPTTYPTSTVDPREDIVFEWEMRKHASNWYCMDEVFHQASAKFYYKLTTDTEWTVVNLGEDECTYTIAADTLPTAASVTWYIETTDDDGVVAESSRRTFQTPTNNIYCTDYPRGDNVDIRNPILFRWILSSTIGDYDQESATLYWKSGQDGTWNEISVTTWKSILVPALTFPTYATIIWYIEATDTGGHTATTAESRFTTPTVAIKAVSYPDGNEVNTERPQVFSWVYSNSKYTDYTQSSATFYWREKYAENWTTVALTGNVKNITFAANTFPTNKTIEWFVEGTDCGGSTSRIGIKSFTTVTTQIVPQNCPTGGYQDPRYDITFSWYYSNVYGDYSQSSAVLYWREVGEEEYTEISVSGDVKTVTVAQNTFPVASEIEWYIAGTDSGGTTTQTGKFTFSTTATTAYAVCIAPVGQVEDGTKPITFSWIVKNDDGSLPLRTVVEWKYDTESQLQWKTLLDTVNTDTEYTVTGGTFHAGAVEWRVSAYNRDLVQGPYNNASFVCLMSPDAPAGLAATPVPRTTIRWQAPGQEGFEITIDDQVITQQYAPGVYSYQVNEPLEDGEHFIKVRVQGQYGLWSNWSETSIKVENDPSNTVTLSGVFDIDAQLLWALGTDDPDAKSNVYRDGIRIAAVGNELSFTDKMAIGEHSYYVELWDDDGNYSRSNTVTGVMTVETMVISEIGGEWMELKLSETSDRNENFQWSRNYALKTVCGAEYPIIEIGTHSTMSGSYACAFDNLAEAERFERLKGKIVVLKSGKLNMMVGAMVRLNKKVTQFYVSYNFTLDQIDWEDFYEPGT